MPVVSVEDEGDRNADEDDVRPDHLAEEAQREREPEEQEHGGRAYLDAEDEERADQYLHAGRAEHQEMRLEMEVVGEVIFRDRVEREIRVEYLRIERSIDERDAEEHAQYRECVA